jgi:hypothetical protein
MVSNSPTELTLTAFLNAKLGELLQEPPMLWLHQAEMAGAKGDSILIREYDDALVPVGFIEVSMPTGSSKEKQTYGYAHNLSHLLGGVAPLFLGAIVRVEGPVELRAYYAALSSTDNKIISDIMLFRGWGVESLARVLGALFFWGQAERKMSSPANWKLRQSRPNVGMHGDYVFKLYDYRDRVLPVLPQDRRSHELGALHLPGAKIVVQLQDCVILRYLLIKGDHCMRTSLQALALLQKLMRFHQSNIVLGDIRLSNIVFDHNGVDAAFIDFDYSGEEGKKHYPHGWVTAIDDGARHGDAEAGSLCRKTHDCFALAAAFLFFEPQSDEKNHSLWQRVIASLLNYSLQDAVDAFDNAMAFRVRVTSNKDVPSGEGSGSPFRPPKLVDESGQYGSAGLPAAPIFTSAPASSPPPSFPASSSAPMSNPPRKRKAPSSESCSSRADKKIQDSE